MRQLFLLFSFLLMVSCAGVRVNYDYDRSYDFKDAKTYGFDVEMESGLSELDQKRLIRILDSTLVSRGYRYSETPAILIDVESGVYSDQNRQNVGIGLGGVGGNIGGGVSVGIPVNMTTSRRVITLNFLDFKDNSIIWQATTDAVFREKTSPSQREEQLRRVVFKSLAKFPPKF